MTLKEAEILALTTLRQAGQKTYHADLYTTKDMSKLMFHPFVYSELLFRSTAGHGGEAEQSEHRGRSGPCIHREAASSALLMP